MDAATIESINHETGEKEYKIVPAGEEGHPETDRILSVKDIAEADDILVAKLYVPEWGASLVVTQFTKQEEMDYRRESQINGVVDRDRLEMLILIHGIKEPKMTAEHIGMLKSKSSVAVDRVLKKVMTMNGMGEAGAAEAAKTFPPRPGTDVPVPAGEGPRVEISEEDAGGDDQSGVRDVDGVLPG